LWVNIVARLFAQIQLQHEFYTRHKMEQRREDIDYKDAYQEQVSIIENLTSKKQDLEFQLAQLKKLVFGSRHEKFVSADVQMAPTLFDIPAITALLDNTTTTIAYQKINKQLRPNHPGRNSFPEHLRREERIINPEGIDPAVAKKIGEDVTETLAYTPAELFVKKVIRPKYLDVATNSICQALAPERSFERSNVDTSLIAQIIVEKFVDHLPLDRQLKRFARLGVTLSDSTMGNWVNSQCSLFKALV
jgi:transposase